MELLPETKNILLCVPSYGGIAIRMDETKMSGFGGRCGQGDAAELITSGFQVSFDGMLRQVEDC
ncbi:hypothetical protein D3C72_2279520 [compost metagenome]|jgi:hypothetical protein